PRSGTLTPGEHSMPRFDDDPAVVPTVSRELFIGWAKGPGPSPWVSLCEAPSYGDAWSELLAMNLGQHTQKVVLRRGETPLVRPDPDCLPQSHSRPRPQGQRGSTRLTPRGRRTARGWGLGREVSRRARPRRRSMRRWLRRAPRQPFPPPPRAP